MFCAQHAYLHRKRRIVIYYQCRSILPKRHGAFHADVVSPFVLDESPRILKLVCTQTPAVSVLDRHTSTTISRQALCAYRQVDLAQLRATHLSSP